jgi:predicted NAD/FAD-binding protein
VYSFERDGLPVDTGQHVLLRCYTAYRALLQRLGVDDLVPVQDRMDIPVLRPGRPVLHLRRTPYTPAPLHLGAALARYSALTPAERVSAARAMTALRKVDYTDPRTDEETFGHWLRERGQGDRALERLWGLVTVAALNIDVDQASLALAAQVFRVGLLEEASAGDIAVPGVPLSRIHHTAAGRLLDRVGVRWRPRSRGRPTATWCAPPTGTSAPTPSCWPSRTSRPPSSRRPRPARTGTAGPVSARPRSSTCTSATTGG